MTSKVENDFSEAHFDTILCFLTIWSSHMALPYGIPMWQGHMAKPYGKAIRQSHMAMPYGKAIWQSHGNAIWHCHMALPYMALPNDKKHEMMSKWASEN